MGKKKSIICLWNAPEVLHQQIMQWFWTYTWTEVFVHALFLTATLFSLYILQLTKPDELFINAVSPLSVSAVAACSRSSPVPAICLSLFPRSTPQGLTDSFLKTEQRHFSTKQICWLSVAAGMKSRPLILAWRVHPSLLSSASNVAQFLPLSPCPLSPGTASHSTLSFLTVAERGPKALLYIGYLSPKRLWGLWVAGSSWFSFESPAHGWS